MRSKIEISTNKDTIPMKQRINGFLLTIRYYISFPYYWLSTRKIDKWLTQVAADERAALLTEKDVEFLKSIGVETTLEELRNNCKKVSK